MKKSCNLQIEKLICTVKRRIQQMKLPFIFINHYFVDALVNRLIERAYIFANKKSRPGVPTKKRFL